MVVIKVEMWPQGDKTKAYMLAWGVVFNDGTGTNAKGNYEAIFTRLPGKHPVTSDWKAASLGKQTKAVVKGFERLRNSVWQLIRTALNAAEVP